MKSEIFKDIEGFEGFYQASNLGRVKSLARTIIRSNGIKQTFNERILRPSLSLRYSTVSLLKNGIRTTKRVHQLVAMAFLDCTTVSRKVVIDHKNNIGTDNRLENLQVITQRSNSTKDRKGGSSKFHGVCWHKRDNKWTASISVDGSTRHLGYFENEFDAAKAYQKVLRDIK